MSVSALPPAAARALERSLEHAIEAVGDPAPRVYQRLFERSPELQALFVMDSGGAVRAEMMRWCFEAVLDLAGSGERTRGLIATEVINHGQVGVPAQQFGSLFAVIREVVRELNGEHWTAQTDAAWTAVLTRVEGLLELPAGAVAGS